MKYIVSFLVVSILTIAMAGAQASPSADEILKEACKQAGKEKKNVFVMFTASWCGWCHRMKNSMIDEDIKKYFNDSFITLYYVVDEPADKKDLETPGGSAFKTKYGGDNQGIPFWIVFNKDGIRIADSMKPDGSPTGRINTGCPANDDEVDYFISVLKRTTTLKEDQLEKISKRFRKNKG